VVCTWNPIVKVNEIHFQFRKFFSLKMETTHNEFQAHYRYISHVIDFLTAFQDGRRILEETSQNSIDKLLRSLRMLRDTSDYFESFTKTELDHPEDPEYPESPENPKIADDPEDPDDPEGPEPWWTIKEEQQPEESS